MFIYSDRNGKEKNNNLYTSMVMSKFIGFIGVT